MIKPRILKEMDALSKELDRMWDQMAYGSRSPRFASGTTTWTPQIDIHETPAAFEIIADLPGLEPEEVEVVVDRMHLKVAGIRNRPAASEEFRVLQAEIGYGRFVRVFRLPSPINPDQVTAAFETGVLTVHLPKTPAPQGRIEIT